MLLLFAPGAPEYAEAYQTMLRCSHDRQPLPQVLDRLTAHLPRSARVVDFGAGSGRITAWLCQRFETVYAVEPSLTMQAEFKKARLPATLLGGTIIDTQLPEPVDMGVINHVYYHIPDCEWGR
jgi:trans-aconitate methyltransferase